jgi:hypothetical protein
VIGGGSPRHAAGSAPLFDETCYCEIISVHSCCPIAVIRDAATS